MQHFQQKEKYEILELQRFSWILHTAINSSFWIIWWLIYGKILMVVKVGNLWLNGDRIFFQGSECAVSIV